MNLAVRMLLVATGAVYFMTESALAQDLAQG